jgi:RNA polymerase sigma-70 factor (ECF subfamily)
LLVRLDPRAAPRRFVSGNSSPGSRCHSWSSRWWPRSATHGPELKAFEVLLRLHHKRLLAYAAALVRQAEVAEDLVQESFIVAWRRMGEFDTSRDFGAWLRGIIRLKYQEWARGRREEPLSKAALESLEDVHARWAQAAEEGRGEAFIALRGCLERLVEASRVAVSLFYLERLPCSAVAERTGSSEETVRKRLQRAREDLARCVRRRMAAPGMQEGGR